MDNLSEIIEYLVSEVKHWMRDVRYHLIYRLGGIPLSHREVRDWQYKAYLKSLAEIRATLVESENVYLEPLTLVGDNQLIANCTFLGNGLGKPMLVLQPKMNGAQIIGNKFKV